MDGDDGRAYTGPYGGRGGPGFEILEQPSGLMFHLPGAPAWVDMSLRPAKSDATDRLEFASGAFEGVPLNFDRDVDGAIAGVNLAGLMRFERVVPDGLTYLCKTVEPIGAAIDGAFSAFYDDYVSGAGGDNIDYDLPYPRHLFLQWLCEERGLLLHGSNDTSIARLEPKRRTMGSARDQNDSGISACADGTWAMAYAILDRARYRGSFHNVVMPFERDGTEVRLYHFSIGETFLHASPGPFTSGSVYLLPSDGFKRVRAAGFSPIGLEFSNRKPVVPIARIAIDPKDFPLLKEIRGHDDSRAIRFVELRQSLFRECRHPQPLDDGYRLHFSRRPGLVDDLKELGEFLQNTFPWIERQLDIQDEGRITLTLCGSTGLRDVLEGDLKRAREIESKEEV